MLFLLSYEQNIKDARVPFSVPEGIAFVQNTGGGFIMLTTPQQAAHGSAGVGKQVIETGGAPVNRGPLLIRDHARLRGIGGQVLMGKHNSSAVLNCKDFDFPGHSKDCCRSVFFTPTFTFTGRGR